jgi:hypothetical protein
MRFFPIVLATGLGLAAVCAAENPFAETARLGQAVNDLAARFGKRYPRSREFLARLDAVEQGLRADNPVVSIKAREDIAALQREALAANPLVRDWPILFVVRRQYAPDHHNTATFFPAARNEYNDGKFTPGGALKAVDFADGAGQVRTLLRAPDGVIRDPETHSEGRRIVFSMRTNLTDSYHLYEINSDGSGLRQLTFARDVDDLDPLYLPDGTIVFSSTREPKYCMCNRHIMANLFRMDADGANIHQIGRSTLFEGHASLLPDGRLLYDRWEYVDRNFGDAQGLWTVNPDGASHALYWGNNTAAPGAVIDARSLPNAEQAICVFGSCHDRPWGALAIIDRRLGLDGPTPVVRTWPPDATNSIRQSGWEIFDAFAAVKLKFEDPYPLSDQYFLCARMTGEGEQMGLFLIDVFGNEVLLHSEPPGCFDPMPLGPKPRPPVLPSRRDFRGQEGFFYVADVYQGSHMQGVKRGAVQWLRVVELPEKRYWTMPVWGGQGIEGPAMNWHDFNNKRILGAVPVEADGSAYFAAPSERFVYFQLLDRNGMMIQSMRSGVIVQSGETAGCTGCHEDRRSAPSRFAAGEARASSAAASPPDGSLASRLSNRAPRRLADWYGPVREFSYRREVQPVFDKHCVRCHDFGTKGGAVLNLAGDRDLVFNCSYNELWRKKFLRIVGAGPADIQPAYSWGSHTSKLGQVVLRYFTEGKLTREEMDRVVTWIDLNAPYYPTYACAYPENLAGRAPLNDAQLARLEQLTGVALRSLASHSGNRGPQVSFDRPELSPCLAKFTDQNHPDCREALAIIQSGKELLAKRPEADAEGFIPCVIDQWRDSKYAARQQREARNRAAILSGRRHYDSPAEP